MFAHNSAGPKYDIIKNDKNGTLCNDFNDYCTKLGEKIQYLEKG